MKILVCGSRLWTKRLPIERELARFGVGRSDVIVVHGAHWEGADDIADKVANAFGFTVRRYPANWTLYGARGGPIRNTEMIVKQHLPAEPIDKCLAFAEDFSRAHGTSDMRNKARAAGILVESFSS